MTTEKNGDTYCNHCDTVFVARENTVESDVVCPWCGVGVVTKNDMLTHPANKPMRITKAVEIISWLGWRCFKRAMPGYAEDHPELRPRRKQ